MRAIPKPVVAVVQGRALAGGAGLATACDIIMAGAGAQIGYPEIQRGFVPAMVMAMLRRLAGEKVALDLVLTGRVLSADEARAAGLVSRVVPDADLDREANALGQAARRAQPFRAGPHQAALPPARRGCLPGRHRARRPGQRPGPPDPRIPVGYRAISPQMKPSAPFPGARRIRCGGPRGGVG